MVGQHIVQVDSHPTMAPASPASVLTASHGRRRWRSFLARLEHMTFAWFTSSMSLGGIASLLINGIIPSTAMYYIGIVLFLTNVVYLSTLIALQILRFTLTPASLAWSLSHPLECCFVPTAVLACATVINCCAGLVGFNPSERCEVALRVVFWIYCVVSLLVSLVCYTTMFGRAEQNLPHMSPAWVLPIFPLMLCGSVATSILSTQHNSQVASLAIAICGLTCQGLGLMLSVLMYAVLFFRLMTNGFPAPRARPGLFMCCGPPAFTIICFLGIADDLPRILPALPAVTYEVLRLVALGSSIFLWCVSAWFYLLTVCALVRVATRRDEREQMEFILAWWACVFPITGFASATGDMGEFLGSTAIVNFARGMVIWIMIIFVGVAIMHVRAVAKGYIMAEGRDEDRVIDTMYHRFSNQPHGGHGADVEKAGEMRRDEPRSNPPTYPSTPAASVRRLDLGKEKEKLPHVVVDTHDSGNISPIPASASASSSSSSSTPVCVSVAIARPNSPRSL